MRDFGKNTFDLMTELFPPGQWKKSKDVAAALGIAHKDGLIGAEVPKLWREENYKVIREHCLVDVRGKWELYKRILVLESI